MSQSPKQKASILPAIQDHNRSFRDYRFIYPVISRRAAGVSIGLNLNPNGACNFACKYCQVPRHELDKKVKDPSIEELVDEIDHFKQSFDNGQLWEHPKFKPTPPELRQLRDISLSGDGEPSYYKDLTTLLPLMQERAKQWGISLQMITNGYGFRKKENREVLEIFRPQIDRIWLKADAWSDQDMLDIYELNEPYEKNKELLIDLFDACSVWLQICVYKDHGKVLTQCSADQVGQQIEAWAKKHPNLEKIQVYTLARQTFNDHLEALSEEEMKNWAKLCATETGLSIEACASTGLVATYEKGQLQT